MRNLGAEKAKNQDSGWQQGCGGGALVKAPEEKWGEMGKAPEEKRGKMGGNGGKWGKMGRKWGGNGGEGDQLHHPSFLIFHHFPPIFPRFPPIFPHFSLPWVHCGYVCGYSTRHRSRVLLSPDIASPLGAPPRFPSSPSMDAGASHVWLQCRNVTAVFERTRLSERATNGVVHRNTRYRKGGGSCAKSVEGGVQEGGSCAGRGEVPVQEGVQEGSKKGLPVQEEGFMWGSLDSSWPGRGGGSCAGRAFLWGFCGTSGAHPALTILGRLPF